MNEKIISQGRHYGRLAFVMVVTAWMLAAVFSQAAKGTEGMVSAVGFAFAAGFGLEFVTAVWTGRASERTQRSSVHR